MSGTPSDRTSGALDDRTSGTLDHRTSGTLDDEDRQEIWRKFNEAVNMTPMELERWLTTEDSRSVGWVRDGEKEAVGHQSGRRILELKRTPKSALSEEDYRHMNKVFGYVQRHMAQGPAEDRTHSRWRYSLMNRGHDPMK